MANAAQGLTEEQVADLKEAFAMFDINGDGTLVRLDSITFMWTSPSASWGDGASA